MTVPFHVLVLNSVPFRELVHTDMSALCDERLLETTTSGFASLAGQTFCQAQGVIAFSIKRPRLKQGAGAYTESDNALCLKKGLARENKALRTPYTAKIITI